MRRRGGSVRNTVLLIVFILLLTAAVVLSVFTEPLHEMQRQAAIAEVLAILDSGTAAVDIAADAYPVRAEEEGVPPLAADAEAFGGAGAVAEERLSEGRVALRLYGAVAIPKISLKLPLYDGAGKTCLRFGAGVVAAENGGVTAIFGYRTGVDGRLLHDLDLLAVGDGVTLTRLDQVRMAYTVAAVRLLKADTLARELAAPPEGSDIAIVSNHPAGETGYRIVVWLAPI